MLKCSLENRASYYSSINSFILLEFNNLLVSLWCLIGHYTPSMLIEKNYAPPWDRNVKLIGRLEILMIGHSMRLNFIFNLNCHCFTSVHLWLFLSVRVKVKRLLWTYQWEVFQYERVVDILRSPAEVTKMVKGLEHLFHESRGYSRWSQRPLPTSAVLR